MDITGECKREFGLYLIASHKIASWEDFGKLPTTCQNALIIDFLDINGITIDRDSLNRTITITDWYNAEKQYSFDMDEMEMEINNTISFSNWWGFGIRKANKIYNENIK